MSTFSVLLFAACAYASFVMLNGNVYYDDDGEIMSGDQLIMMCYDQQSCTTHFGKNVYATTRPVLDHEWTPLLFPDMYDQFDSESVCGSGSKFISMDTCAQIHAPMTPYHPEGEISVSYVEEQYTLKWENIRNSDKPIYDAFLDNSVAYWTDDLAKYDSLWTEVGADIVYLKWTIKNDAAINGNSGEVLDGNSGRGTGINSEIESKTYYSIITHNGNAGTGSTLTQYELISDTFSGITDKIIKEKFIESEQRAFFDELTDYRSFSVGCETVPIGPRRAVSDVDANVQWYIKIFSNSILDVSKQVIVDSFIDYNGNTVKYAHIKLYPSEESTTVSFFERDISSSDSSTYGDFSVLDFEKAMTDTHNENMVSPFCGIDRWFDMHYAIDFDDADTSEKIFETLMKSGEKYTVYEEWGSDVSAGERVMGNAYPTFVYMTEPNGHSVQMIFDMNIDMDFITIPAQWDATWCPIDCSDEMLNYDYGDIIATFSWNSDESDNSDNSYDDESFVVAQDTNTSHDQAKQSMYVSNLAAIILGIAGILSITLVIFINYCRCCDCDRFKYEKIPQ